MRDLLVRGSGDGLRTSRTETTKLLNFSGNQKVSNQMPKRIPILLALSVALSGLFVGCGGGGNTTLSKSEFIKKADEICKREEKTRSGEAAAYLKVRFKGRAPLSREETIEKLVGAVLLPSVLKEAERIEALGAPSGDEEKVKDFIRGIEEAVKKAEKNPGSVAVFSEDPFRAVDNLAREYGFHSCSNVA
jgi:hypothetical protein